MRKLLFTSLWIFFCVPVLFGQLGTTLLPGDVAFIGYTTVGKTNEDVDAFSFILLKEMEGNTRIFFTDRGWDNNLNAGDGDFADTGEDNIFWQAPAGGLPAGTILIVELDNNTIEATDPDITDPGVISPTSNMLLDFDDQGDQIFAYQGSTGDFQLLAGLHMNGDWDQNMNGQGEGIEKKSMRPSILDDTPAFVLAFNEVSPAGPLNAVFSADITGTKEEILTALLIQENWMLSKKSEPAFNLGDLLGAVVLPIELTDFSADWQADHVLIEWRTASEFDNDFMAVERSTDAKDFQEIGRVQGEGTTYLPRYYQLIDSRPSPGVNYYRLRQVDFDGSVHYSKVIAALVPENATEVRLYPSPARNWLTVQLQTPTKQSGHLEIAGTDGRLWQTRQVASGETDLQIDLGRLPAGSYFIRLTLARNQQVFRFIKK